ILRREAVDNLRLAQLLNEMALLLLDRGDLENAAAIFEESVAMKKRLVGDREVSVSIALTNLGKVREMLGRYQEAEAAYRESLRIKQALYGEGAEELAILENNLAVLLTDLGQLEPERRGNLWQEAEELFRRSLEARLEGSPPDDPRIAKVHKNRALLLTFRGELEAAEPLLDEALAIFRSHYGDDDRAVAETLRNRAVMLHAAGRFEAAESDAGRAAEIFNAAFGAEDWRTADAESIRGECLLDLSRVEEAAAMLNKSLAIIEGEKGEQARAAWEARRRLERLRSIRAATSDRPADG
ncbi:MAG: tetratricopeptide repeat protein, partial [Thermoanaerobaculia bacterium]